MSVDSTSSSDSSAASAPALREPQYRVVREPDAKRIARLSEPPPLAEWVQLAQVHAESSDHQPPVRAALRYSDTAMLLWFHVEDRYVVSRHTGYQQNVCRDSCVEWFFQPDPEREAYFNIEINAGGALLMHFGSGRPTREPLPDATLDLVHIETTLPQTVIPERQEPTTWGIACTVPYAALSPSMPDVPMPPTPGSIWYANFYKCADQCSHPHWITWSSIGELKDYHQPDRFGTLIFE